MNVKRNSVAHARCLSLSLNILRNGLTSELELEKKKNPVIRKKLLLVPDDFYLVAREYNHPVLFLIKDNLSVIFLFLLLPFYLRFNPFNKFNWIDVKKV